MRFLIRGSKFSRLLNRSRCAGIAVYDAFERALQLKGPLDSFAQYRY